jgi:hypothetical protein
MLGRRLLPSREANDTLWHTCEPPALPLPTPSPPAPRLQDDALFARNFAQLKAYYTDLAALLPPSEQQHPILGLNLLRLLAQNRIAEFHIELELLDNAALASPHVDFPRQLERNLMEGLYDRLYGAMDAAPPARRAGRVRRRGALLSLLPIFL